MTAHAVAGLKLRLRLHATWLYAVAGATMRSALGPAAPAAVDAPMANAAGAWPGSGLVLAHGLVRQVRLSRRSSMPAVIENLNEARVSRRSLHAGPQSLPGQHHRTPVACAAGARLAADACLHTRCGGVTRPHARQASGRRAGWTTSSCRTGATSGTACTATTTTSW
jgi:hypothetical protein